MATNHLLICLSPLYIVTSITGGRFLSMLLPDIHPVFDRKPFNCCPCLTFHLCGIIFTAAATVTQCAALMGAGIITAFIVFFIIKYIDNQKIEK